ncbi:helix-turn-helix domain-containing protein [Bacillus sp. PS06]|uniref:helix-turn-helix domain-containing protein n=1 Tax=Bacillus sp. PS06 TaxID=2764176 RepID=UPI001780AE2B|nr:helix-turn-helix domain-containing protein [Bacillus sp. PS06]MBD8070289.1 helix-turn-helix domain-containing protein [Bacillus sp. PS06]
MNVSFRSFILLYCINKVNGERSIYGIYHILTGKKSSQAMTDGEFYQLSFLFSVMKKLSREDLIISIDELVSKGLIKMLEEHIYIATPKGNSLLKEEAFTQQCFVNGRKYHDTGVQFWQKLTLLIQVLSNLLRDNKEYITIQQDQHILNWTKHFLLNNTKKKQELSLKIYKECEKCLSEISELEATIFVMKLSSEQRIGWTNKQIATFLSLDETKVEFLFLNVIHYLLSRVEKAPQSFPALYEIFISINKRSPFLTESSEKTYQLLKSGKTIEEVATIRKLKKSTIEDHIVEIVQHDSQFSINPFVSKEKQAIIQTTQQSLKTLRLKQIKDVIKSDVTYFEIRLVLARSGVNK